MWGLSLECPDCCRQGGKGKDQPLVTHPVMLWMGCVRARARGAPVLLVLRDGFGAVPGGHLFPCAPAATSHSLSSSCLLLGSAALSQQPESGAAGARQGRAQPVPCSPWLPLPVQVCSGPIQSWMFHSVKPAPCPAVKAEAGGLEQGRGQFEAPPLLGVHPAGQSCGCWVLPVSQRECGACLVLLVGAALCCRTRWGAGTACLAEDAGSQESWDQCFALPRVVVALGDPRFPWHPGLCGEQHCGKAQWWFWVRYLWALVDSLAGAVEVQW